MSEEVEWSKILFDRIIGVKLIANRLERNAWTSTREEYTKTNYDKTAGGYDTELTTYSTTVYSDEEYANEYEINIPAVEHGGLKPDITFSASLLPGEMFHEVTLTIKNYKMPFDIRKYTRMEITAGYRKQDNGGTQFDEVLVRTFPIEIFYSYNLTPAPDSVTVFKGVIVSSFTDNNIEDYFSTTNNYEMRFYRDVTVEEYINRALELINLNHYNLSLAENIPESAKRCLMNTGPDSTGMYGKTFTFSSIPDILRSIVNMLETAYSYLGKPGSFNVHISDGILVIFCTDGYYSTDEAIINLDCISSATLNAGIMNVTAPWYPPLIPGAIIKVSREYIDGSDLPNVIDVDELMGVDNLYRVLTMDVEFSSIGATNSMKITSIPLKYAESNTFDGGKEAQKEFEHKFKVMQNEAQEIMKQIKEKDTTASTTIKGGIPTYSLEIGEPPEEENPVFQWALANESLLKDIKISDVMQSDKLIGSLCVESLYKDFPSLDMTTIYPSTYSIESEQILGSSLIPVYDSQWLWPIVYAATYLQYYKGKKNRNGEDVPDYLNPFTLNKKTSNVVVAGKRVAYPYKLKTWNDIKAYKELYKEAAKLTNLSLDLSRILDNLGDILNIMP